MKTRIVRDNPNVNFNIPLKLKSRIADFCEDNGIPLVRFGTHALEKSIDTLTGEKTHAQAALALVLTERKNQDRRWGEQNFPLGVEPGPETELCEEATKAICEASVKDGTLTWQKLLDEEYAEFTNAKDDNRLVELVQLAALSLAAIESYLRNGGK